MSYKVFALKWRPQTFDEVIGQKHIVATLKSALQNNRIAHAYLFAGPRGVGKTSTARILAKALNCKVGPTVEPCQKCPSCMEISTGRSFDVIEIDGASNRGIDEIRALRENVKFAPTQGKFKIYIIDEVHQITPDGFNALLKTLEEPPPFVKFIFATTHPQKIMPTILSRCQRFDFRHIPVMEIIAQLERIVKEEKISVDKDVLFAIAKSSDGSLRDAESILDQLVSFSQGNVSLKDVISVLGMVEQDVLFDLTDKIIKKEPKEVLGLLNQIIDEGKDTSVFLNNLVEHFRNLMIAKVAQADSVLIDLPPEVCQRLWQQAQSLSMEEIFSAFNILVNTQEMTKRLDSARIPLEISLVKLAYDRKAGSQIQSPGPTIIRKEITPLPSRPERSQQTTPTPKIKDSGFSAAKTVALHDNLPKEEVALATAGGGVLSLEEIEDAWQDIIGNLKQVKISVATYLEEGTLLKCEHSVLTVSFPRSYSLHKESLEMQANRMMIEKAMSDRLKTRARIVFTLTQEEAHKNDIKNDVYIQSALEAFNGRVIKEE